jgi:hypothetical protein
MVIFCVGSWYDWYQVVKIMRFSSKIHPSVLINRDLRLKNGPLQSDAFLLAELKDCLG